jgi:hypothetical protein
MKPAALVVAALLTTAVAAQERKPVPKDSVRVFVPGCSKGYVFTAGRPAEDQPGGSAIPEGTHLRMNGPKKMMAEIKGHEGTRIEITGLVRKGQTLQDGVSVGGGIRIGPAASPAGGGLSIPGGGQVMIDVEGWRALAGDCPSR